MNPPNNSFHKHFGFELQHKARSFFIIQNREITKILIQFTHSTLPYKVSLCGRNYILWQTEIIIVDAFSRVGYISFEYCNKVWLKFVYMSIVLVYMINK